MEHPRAKLGFSSASVVSPWYLPAKTKAPPRKAACQAFDFLRKTGTGEAIRTLDPNLGKVVNSWCGRGKSNPHGTKPDGFSYQFGFRRLALCAGYGPVGGAATWICTS
jgi:hypothetical protein